MDKQERQNKESEILAAAEQEFLAKGYDGARTTSIAQAAGVTHAMLHYYFRTKEQLFERILDEKFRVMSQSMLAVFGDPNLPVLERIKGGIETHFDFIAANPELPRFVINEIITRPERYEVLHRHVGGTVNDIYKNLQVEIDNAAERGEIEKLDIQMLLISIMSLNIFSFVAYPFMQPIMGRLMSDREGFLEERKRENVETIMRRIKRQ